MDEHKNTIELRLPSRLGFEKIAMNTAASVAVGLLDIALHGDRLLRSLGEGRYAVIGTDLMAMAMGVGFAWLAVATRRRGREGDPCSIWAWPRAPETAR